MSETNYTEEMSQKINRFLYLISLENIDRFNKGYLPHLEAINQDVINDDRIPVWVCWWQGLENAPDIVKKCVTSIERNIPKDKARLIVITFDNYVEYIDFSETIVNRVNTQAITLTHLSDILRAQLLYRYGGMWIDATYFISDDRICADFEYDAFSIKAGVPTWSGDVHAKGRWMSNYSLTPKRSVLNGFLCESYELYWQMREELLDYFLIDRFTLIAYENIAQVRAMIDAYPTNNKNTLKLIDCINDAFDQTKWDELRADTYAFKLSYKQDIKKQTESDEDTFYKILLGD